MNAPFLPLASRDNDALNRLSDRLFQACLIGFALVFALLTLFAFPQADDWCYGAIAAVDGFPGAIRTWFLTWTGIYTAVALTSLPLIVLDVAVAVPVISLASMALSFAGIWLLSSALAPESAPAERRTAALTIWCVYLACMPAPAQGYYWPTAATQYLAAVWLTAIGIALIFPIGSNGTRRRVSWPRLLAISIVGLLVSGTNGAIGAALTASLAIVILITWPGTHRADLNLLVALAATAIGTAIVIASPGNAVRLSSHAGERAALVTLASSARSFIEFGLTWTSTLTIWAGAASLLPYFVFNAPAWSSARPARSGLSLLLATGATLAILIVAPTWAVGAVPSRLMNFAYFVYLLMLLAFVWLVVSTSANTREKEMLRSSPWLRAATRIVLLVALASSTTFHAALNDLFSAIRFRQEAAAQIAPLRRAAFAEGGTLAIAPIATRMRLLQFAGGGFSSDPNNFANKCAATYFGAKSLRLSLQVNSPH